jgi:hypothetical protein
MDKIKELIKKLSDDEVIEFSDWLVKHMLQRVVKQLTDEVEK